MGIPAEQSLYHTPAICLGCFDNVHVMNQNVILNLNIERSPIKTSVQARIVLGAFIKISSSIINNEHVMVTWCNLKAEKT